VLAVYRHARVAIFGWVAEQERTRLVERIHAGLDRAKKQGTRSGKAIGRPRVLLPRDADRIRKLREAGKSWAAAAKAVGCSPRTAARALR
jgi:DNA invertase Pin-like site-specific DNA recombinase